MVPLSPCQLACCACGALRMTGTTGCGEEERWEVRRPVVVVSAQERSGQTTLM